MATMTRAGSKQAARDLAEWLVAFEAGTSEILSEDRLATCRVCEKLRRPLSHLTGVAGFSSLLARALTLAQREDAALIGVRVTPDGTLDGLSGEAAKGITTLIANLIELLTTFIGESLTLRLLHDIWPDLPASEANPGERTRHESVQ